MHYLIKQKKETPMNKYDEVLNEFNSWMSQTVYDGYQGLQGPLNAGLFYSATGTFTGTTGVAGDSTTIDTTTYIPSNLTDVSNNTITLIDNVSPNLDSTVYSYALPLQASIVSNKYTSYMQPIHVIHKQGDYYFSSSSYDVNLVYNLFSGSMTTYWKTAGSGVSGYTLNPLS